MDRGGADELASYRAYLLMLARAQIGAGRVGADVDPSDVVQQTLLAAHERRDDFRGATPGERLGWLRAILASKVADAARRGRRRPDARAPEAWVAAIEASSRRLEAWLADDGPSPPARVLQAERALRLASALARLPEDQRRAIEAHYLRGLTVPEVAEAQGRTTASIAGLVRRGLMALREGLADSSAEASR